MIRGRVKQAMEEMGFEFRFEQWVTKKVDGRSGSVLTYIAKEEADFNGVPLIRIYCYDTGNNLLGHCTLDQMMNDLDTNLEPLPKPTNNAYKCVYNVRVEVPLQMASVMPETYQMYFEQGFTEEEDIAEQVARYDLNEFLSRCDAPFNLLEIEPEYTEKIK